MSLIVLVGLDAVALIQLLLLFIFFSKTTLQTCISFSTTRHFLKQQEPFALQTTWHLLNKTATSPLLRPLSCYSKTAETPLLLPLPFVLFSLGSLAKKFDHYIQSKWYHHTASLESHVINRPLQYKNA